MYVYKSMAESRVTNAALRAISLAAQDHAVDEGGTAPVSPCVPLCAIFLRKPSVLPAFGGEGKRGPFVREVEKRDERWPEIELLLIVRVHREPGNVCI